MPVKVSIAGAAGRMGKNIIHAASMDPQIVIVSAFEKPDSPFIGKDAGELAGLEKLGITVSDNPEDSISLCDVLIDFTMPDATLKHLEIAQKNNKKIVIGTTGFTDEQISKIRSFARTIPVVFSPNMSMGVNLLFSLVEKVSSVLRDYDVEIIEAHHKFKKDSPSGTADKLAKIIAETFNKKLDEIAVYGRKGLLGERRKQEIGIHAVRGGDIIGDHTVLFAGDGERLELKHQAHSRMGFATGALRAAKFVSTKAIGFYTMKEVLGL